MYENDKQKEELNLAKEKLSSAFTNLSDTFKTTGVPQTMNDMFFVTQYPDAYGKMSNAYKDVASNAQTAQTKQSEAQDALDLIDDIASKNTDPVTAVETEAIGVTRNAAVLEMILARGASL